MNGNKKNRAFSELTEETLPGGELSFHALFTAMTEGVAVHQMIFDDDGKAVDYLIMDVNPSFEKNLGIPADKAKGALASKLYGLTPPPYLDIYEQVLKTGEPYYFTTYFQPLDRYFEISVFIPKKDWFATVFLDVTGSKRAVEELRATGIKYRRLYESMMDGFARTDLQGQIKEFNSCFQSMLGYSGKELLELTYQDITPLQWHSYEKRIVENQVIPFGYSDVFEKEYIKKDGTVFPVELRISLIRDEQGKPQGMWAVVRDITDRKRSEQELERMVDRFNLAVRSGNMGVWEWDLKTSQELWDDKMLELYGIEREEFFSTHQNWLDILHPEDVDRTKEELRLALSGEKVYDTNFRIVLKNGDIRFIKAFAQVVRDSAGTPLRLTGINYDITEQKKIEESLLISEMFNRGLVESAPVGILFLDQTGRITFENPAMQQMMGLPKDKESVVIGKLFQELESIKAVISKSEISQILKGERINARELHYTSLLGSELDLEIYTAPLMNSKGEVQGIILMAVDISKPVAAGKELRKSEQKYRMLYESIRDGFIMMDMKKHILESNSFFLTMTGYSAEDLRAMKGIRDIVPEKWYEKVDSILENEVMPLGYSDVFEIEYRRKDNTIFPVEVRLFLIKNQNGKNEGLWAIVRDITERKKQDKNMIHTERMARIGVMAAGMAHEINQPLNTISLAMDNLILSINNGSSDKSYLENKTIKIFDNITRIRNIIDHVRAFSKDHDDYIQSRFNINESIRNAKSMILEQFKHKGIHFVMDLDKTLPQPIGNTFKFEQVIVNLLINAKDAIEEKEMIPGMDFKKVVEIHSSLEKQYVCVEVRDNGIGIDAKDTDKVMLPFYSTKGEGASSGLGLSISFGIIRDMNGTIDIQSERLKGTTVRIMIPVKKEETKSSEMQ
jgi:PAS domain S-box-containing protein